MLVGVLGRDRPTAFQACLHGIAQAGVEHRVVIHLDEPEREVAAIAEASGHQVLIADRQIGIGASLNRILVHREQGEPFCRVDGDTVPATKDWLKIMVRNFNRWGAVAACLWQWGGGWGRGVTPSAQTVRLIEGRGTGSLMVVRGDVLDRMGGFRTERAVGQGTFYSFEDSDFYLRMKRLGERVGVDRRVITIEAAEPTRKGWRIVGSGKPPPEFVALQRRFHSQVAPIYRPVVGVAAGGQ